MARQWILRSQKGWEASLEYQNNLKIPIQSDLGPHDVLVKLFAASLNYRDVVIPSSGAEYGPVPTPLIPGCDGAGVVQVVGSSVKDFRPGDRVITCVAPKTAEMNGDGALPSLADALLCLGHGTDGTLCSHGVFSEKGIVHAPASLDWIHASTLSCNWSTAWNTLFGLKGNTVGPDKWVLVQGTGGVSIAMLQLAMAAGATVVATTSTEDKSARLLSLGAKHTVNYRTNPDNWGLEARKLTPDGRGFDFIIDVGGDETLAQSLAAVRTNGIVSPVGAVGKSSEPVPLLAAFPHTCIVRTIIAGSRAQLQEAVRFIDEKGIKPVVDDVVFELQDAKDAYRRLQEKKHFSKVVIHIDHSD